MKGSPLAGARGLELYPAAVYKAISIRVEKKQSYHARRWG